MNKRVLVLSNMYPTKDYPTFGIFVKKQVEQLKGRGWLASVVAIHDPRSGKVNVVRKYLLWMFQAFLHVLLKGKQYQVVHVHYVFPAGIFGLMAKKLWKRRLIVTVHGGDIDKMARKNERIFNWTKRILHEADHVICVGHGLYQDLREDFEVEAGKLSIISMGVDQQIFKPRDPEAIKQKLNVQDQKVILFVGNIIREKGVLELLEAFQNVHQSEPTARLHLAGTHKQAAFLTEVEQKLSDLSIEDAVTFHGVLSPEDVAEWMNTAEMLVLPSWMEGFGLVALEAMSSGTVVVGSDVGGLSVLLKDECGIRVPVKDAGKLAEAMENVLSDDAQVATIQQNGLRRASEHNSEALLDKVIAIYKGELIDEQQTETN
ncbi:glycosyltransferase [Aquibacillus sediminis]|uniref:glycosyltransferase n=1 Tax=Aquibacillus sediminis TaxID=2574734 RepID=UPI00110880F9|nr:glycosyltransferase [Aquibacillus sediminis]